MLIKESIYINLKNYNNVIMNNILFNIKLKINTFFIKIIYRIV